MALALALSACGNSGDDDEASEESGETPATVSDADLDENVPVEAPGVTDTEIHVVDDHVEDEPHEREVRRSSPTA